jgi:hypothetical protein
MPALATKNARIVEYDSISRRLWILGQRCHHGAGGSLLAAVACVAVVTEPVVSRPRPVPTLVALVAAGGAMMAHDWKDHSIWFERGYGTQP